MLLLLFHPAMLLCFQGPTPLHLNLLPHCKSIMRRSIRELLLRQYIWLLLLFRLWELLQIIQAQTQRLILGFMLLHPKTQDPQYPHLISPFLHQKTMILLRHHHFLRFHLNKCQFIPLKCLPLGLHQGRQRCLSGHLFQHYHLRLLMEIAHH